MDVNGVGVTNRVPKEPEHVSVSISKWVQPDVDQPRRMSRPIPVQKKK